MSGKAADLGHHFHQSFHILQDCALQLQNTKAVLATNLASQGRLWPPVCALKVVSPLLKYTVTTKTIESVWLGNETPPVEG